MVEKLKGYLMTKQVQHKCLIKVRPFNAARVKCMYDHVRPTLRDCNPNWIILHIGTNDLKEKRKASQIAKSIIDLAISIKSEDIKVVISLIVPRYDILNNKAFEVNDRLKNMCKERNILYIDHSETIQPENHLNNGNLHLNRYGTNVFSKNFTSFIEDMF